MDAKVFFVKLTTKLKITVEIKNNAKNGPDESLPVDQGFPFR